MSDESRPYTKRLRAEQEAETRRRIAESAMALHGTLGPARTSISAVAEHAGVRRSTVYRHYPDEAALFAACSSLWAHLNPFPDLAALPEGDADARREAGFAAIYGFYRANAGMLGNVLRDAESTPAMAESVGGFVAVIEDAARRLALDLPAQEPARRRMAAAMALALSFATWRTLALERGLEDAEAASLMRALAARARDGG